MPHSARIWNYWLGGKDNYVVDRAAGDEYMKVFPGVVQMARASRGFLSRSVRYLAGEAGIRQFLDVGTGLPTVDNTHQTRLTAGLPSGSYLSINDGTQVVAGEALAEAQQDYNDTGAVPYQLRTPDEIAGFFAGLEPHRNLGSSRARGGGQIQVRNRSMWMRSVVSAASRDRRRCTGTRETYARHQRQVSAAFTA